MIHVLFNENEDYMDCKASYTCIQILLEKQSPEIEKKIIESFKVGISRYSTGHRFYENSLLDLFIEDIFPTFTVESIIDLISTVRGGMLKSSVRGGDDLISVVKYALDKSEQQKFLDEIFKIHN